MLEHPAPCGAVRRPIPYPSPEDTMHRRIRNTVTKKRRIGFRARMKTKSGRKIISRRRRRHGTFP